MAVTILNLLISLSIMFDAVATLPQANLYRDLKRQIAFGNFKPDQRHKLVGTKIASSLVSDIIDCTLNCVSESLCKSFNIAASPDSENLYLCELLDTDKHRVSVNDLQANPAFNHYSPWYPCQPGAAGFHCDRQGKTCSDIKLHSPQAKSGSYVIDPDEIGGYEPFTVSCDMTDKYEVGVTVIGHDSEDRMLVNGLESRGSYVRDVNYIGGSVAQLAVLSFTSAHCEQFIKYECVGSTLFRGESPHGWWVSRDNIKMTYWGGATSANPYKCACGVTDSCADKSFGCNCDKNDAVSREDSGLLTEKLYLPVTQLRFGDTSGANEKGYQTLGKFKCYGIA